MYITYTALLPALFPCVHVQARNISVTVRTILQGLVWLATFIFCVNSVGLLGTSCIGAVRGLMRVPMGLAGSTLC